jgi:hypothetical protein
VWVASQVDIDALSPHARVVVSGWRDGPAGRAIADRILAPAGVPPLPGESGPRPIESRGPDGARILQLVLSLLVEQRLDAQVLECALLPSNDLYAVRLQIPEEVGKAILLPRRVLERACVEPLALRTVRNLLRSAVETLRSQRAISDARLTWYTTGSTAASWPGPRCARCEGPLFVDDPLVIQGDARWHMECPPTW